MVTGRWLCIAGLALTSHPQTQSAQAEQQREALFIRLRALGVSAVPALRRGLADSDAQITVKRAPAAGDK